MRPYRVGDYRIIYEIHYQVDLGAIGGRYLPCIALEIYR